MAHFRKDEPGYWQIPEKYAAMAGDPDAWGMRAGIFVLGDPQAEDVPTAMIIEMQPGAAIARHAHPCERFEVVVAGSLLVDGNRPLHPGDVMVAHPGEMYGPHVAGPDGATVVEFFGTARGAHVMIYDTPDGPQMVDFLDGAERPAGVVTTFE